MKYILNEETYERFIRNITEEEMLINSEYEKIEADRLFFRNLYKFKLLKIIR